MVGMSQTDALTCLETQFIAHIDVERGLSKATVTAYTSDLDRYCAWLREAGITEPASISRNHVEEYIAHLDSHGVSARSKARNLASIHEFHRFALAQHAVADDVSAAVKAPKGASTLPDVLTVDEVARLLDCAPVPAPGCVMDVPHAVLMRDKALLLSLIHI